MPSVLRSRVALFVLLGALLIPISMSSLRGLTHVLTCQQEAKTPFTVYIPPTGPPLVAPSSRLTRGQATTLCGGLTLNMGAKVLSRTRIAMVLPIKNQTSYLWRGTVKLVLGRTSIPIDIGSIPAGTTRTAKVPFHVAGGTTDHIAGSLLIGP
ncbi:MAG: hypothetical protein M3P18_04810 [Actinomycetota bacterium]|nr:hypothetical protein [Actinomycetota bacterium]